MFPLSVAIDYRTFEVVFMAEHTKLIEIQCLELCHVASGQLEEHFALLHLLF